MARDYIGDAPARLEWRPAHHGGQSAYAGDGTTLDVVSRDRAQLFQPWEKPAGGWVAGYGLLSGGSMIPRLIDARGQADVATAGGWARFRHADAHAAKAAAEQWYARRTASLRSSLGAVPGRTRATSVRQLARELGVSARDAADLARNAGLTVERDVIVDRTADGSGWDTLHAQCTPCTLNALRAKRSGFSQELVRFGDRLGGSR